jgi:type II secretory pathway component PulC
MFSQRVLSTVLSAATLVLLAIVCAYWFWIFAAPTGSAAVEPLTTATTRPLDAIRRARLFGEGAGVATAAPVRTDLVLRGISASKNGGLAVIALDRSRTVTVRSGDEIAPGILLERVLHDHVIVVQNGMTQRIELPQRKPVDTSPIAAVAGTAGRK